MRGKKIRFEKNSFRFVPSVAMGEFCSEGEGVSTGVER